MEPLAGLVGFGILVLMFIGQMKIWANTNALRRIEEARRKEELLARGQNPYQAPPAPAQWKQAGQ